MNCTATNIVPKKGQETAEAILNAATDLLQQHCLHTISIRDIASKAGVNSALISYYYHGKEELYLAVVQKLFNAYKAEVVSKINLLLPLRESIRNTCTLLANFHKNNPCWLVLYFRELSNSSAAYESIIRPCMAEASMHLVAIFKKAQAMGTIRQNIKPSFAALTMVSMINYCFMTMKAMRHDQQFNMASALDEYVDHVVEILEGLTTPLAVNS